MAVLAFSLADHVEKYGAYVGIASFLGLAILSILYFAQAREVKRLREWAGRAPERAREVEERAMAQAAEAGRRFSPASQQARPVAQPVGAAVAGGAPPVTDQPTVEADSLLDEDGEGSGAQDAAAAGRNGTLPPGVEPALPTAASAEDVVADDATAAEEAVGTEAEENDSPAGEREDAPGEASAGEDAPGEASAAEDAPGDGSAGEDAPGDGSAGEDAPGDGSSAEGKDAPGETSADEAKDAPSVVGGTSPGEDDVPAVAGEVPRAAERSAANGAGAAPPLPAPATAASGRRPSGPSLPRPAAVPLRAPVRSTTTPPPAARPAGSGEGRTVTTWIAVCAIAVVVLAGGGYAAIKTLTGGDDEKPTASAPAAPAASAKATASKPKREPTGVSAAVRAATTVSVLNGTGTQGLAAKIQGQLVSAGYQKGITQNAQGGATTVVYYANGSKAAAADIARRLDTSDVRPIDSQTLAAGGAAKVVVILGQDQAG